MRKRILHLEDDMPNQGLVKTILGDEYDLVQVETIDGMLDQLQVEDYDLLVTDTEIGRESILDYIDSLADIYPDLVIIGLSGNHNLTSQWLRLVLSDKNRVMAYLEKPFHPEELLSKVRLAMEIRTQLDSASPKTATTECRPA